jgi:predicted RNA-binding protein associated with RNAse of E/G family
METRDIEHRYRRRLLNGAVNVSTSVGPASIAHDTSELLVIDHLWGGHPMTSLWARQEVQLEYRGVFAARTWWWTDRPLRLIQAFSASGELLTYRVDFATRPMRDGAVLEQTDWYLDLFVSGDGRRYVIDDEDELAEAVARDLVTAEQAAEAQEQCAFLVQLVGERSLAAWLRTQCSTPFERKQLPTQPHVWTYTEAR